MTEKEYLHSYERLKARAESLISEMDGYVENPMDESSYKEILQLRDQLLSVQKQLADLRMIVPEPDEEINFD